MKEAPDLHTVLKYGIIKHETFYRDLAKLVPQRTV